MSEMSSGMYGMSYKNRSQSLQCRNVTNDLQCTVTVNISTELHPNPTKSVENTRLLYLTHASAFSVIVTAPTFVELKSARRYDEENSRTKFQPKRSSSGALHTLKQSPAVTVQIFTKSGLIPGTFCK